MKESIYLVSVFHLYSPPPKLSLYSPPIKEEWIRQLDIENLRSLILKIYLESSPSYYLPVSVYLFFSHSGVVVLHTLYIGQIDTRICHYLINFANLYPLLLPHIRDSSVLIPSFIPP